MNRHLIINQNYSYYTCYHLQLPIFLSYSYNSLSSSSSSSSSSLRSHNRSKIAEAMFTACAYKIGTGISTPFTSSLKSTPTIISTLAIAHTKISETYIFAFAVKELIGPPIAQTPVTTLAIVGKSSNE